MPPADPDAYGTSWYAATAMARPPRPPLTAETDVDVCVIGAGLAGLTVAREVARRGWSVVVLEAKSVAWNASSRNSGFVVPGFAAETEALITRVGLDHARRLWALSEAGVAYVRNAIAEAAMPGVEPAGGGWLRVSKTGRDGIVEREAERLTALGAKVEVWHAPQVREQLRSPYYSSAIHLPDAFSIHPLNYALGLAAAAEASGARIHEGSEALQIDPVGVRKRIVTNDARLRAAHVVLAGNVHVGRLMPQFAATLLPIHRYVVVAKPVDVELDQTIRFPGAVSDTAFADNHYRIVDGERLLWSGRSTAWRGKPSRYVGTLLRDLGRTYPALGKMKVERAWTGTFGQTVHQMPQIGEISPGLWLLSGFGDHGLNTTAMGGELVARAIVDGDRTLQLFEPFEMVWAGGTVGRTVHQLYAWGYRAGERAATVLARRSRRRAVDRPKKKRPQARPTLQAPVWDPQPAPPARGSTAVAAMPVAAKPSLEAEPELPFPEPVAAPQPSVAALDEPEPVADVEQTAAASPGEPADLPAADLPAAGSDAPADEPQDTPDDTSDVMPEVAPEESASEPTAATEPPAAMPSRDVRPRRRRRLRRGPPRDRPPESADNEG